MCSESRESNAAKKAKQKLELSFKRCRLLAYGFDQAVKRD